MSYNSHDAIHFSLVQMITVICVSFLFLQCLPSVEVYTSTDCDVKLETLKSTKSHVVLVIQLRD